MAGERTLSTGTCAQQFALLGPAVCSQSIFIRHAVAAAAFIFVNMPNTDLNPVIENPHATPSLLAVAMFVVSVTVREILTVEICITLTLTSRTAKVKCKYANRKATSDYLCVGNNNVCPICHRLRDVKSRKVHDLNSDLQNGSRLNVYMPNERTRVTFYVLAAAVSDIIMFELSNVSRTRFEYLTFTIK